jgi:flagellum-specific peptidoglycan hydrolase FlgJ
MLTPAQQAAIQQIAEAAVASEMATGVPAAMSAAQCVFESAWLTRAPGNNCFGIKVDQRGSGTQYILTHEYINGTWEEMPLAFETYASLADCFADHARLIQQGVYAPAWAQYQQDQDLDAYISRVAKHYATDPGYATEVTSEAHSATVQNAIAAARIAA